LRSLKTIPLIGVLLLGCLSSSVSHAVSSCGSPCRINRFGYGLYWYEAGSGNAVDHYVSADLFNTAEAETILTERCKEKGAAISEKARSELVGSISCSEPSPGLNLDWQCSAECRPEGHQAVLSVSAFGSAREEAWAILHLHCEKIAWESGSFKFTLKGAMELACEKELADTLFEIVIE
jgi:hypothetical protein